jgi:hypothetical protein
MLTAKLSTLIEGYRSEAGGYGLGMHAGVSPELIPQNQVSRAVNYTFRTGWARTRPGFAWRDWSTFSDTSAVSDGRLSYGRFQGAAYYEYEDTQIILAVYGGRVFSIDPVTRIVTRADGGTQYLSSIVDRVYMQSHNRFMVIQDGQNAPLIIEGATHRYADYAGKREVMTGTIMASGHGFLCVASVDRRYFQVSDHELLETTGLYPGASPLTFTVQQDYLYAGDRFYPPASHGKITAMAVIPYLDSSTGTGRLYVFAERGISTWDISNERSVWLTKDISTAAINGFGAVGPWCVSASNSDLYYRGFDGVRSVGTVQRDFNQQDNTPLSREVEPYTQTDTPWLAYFTNSVVFDQRYLVTTQSSVYKVDTSAIPGAYADGTNIAPFLEVGHRGLLALNFVSLSSINGKSPPLWDGLWTGPSHIHGMVTGIFNGRPRLFVFGRDKQLHNRMWESDDLVGDDQVESQRPDGLDARVPIETQLWMRIFDWGSAHTRKRWQGGSFNLGGMAGEFCGQWGFFPDAFPQPTYTDGSHRLCAPSCMQYVCGKLIRANPQARGRIAIGGVTPLCDTSSNEPRDTFYNAQPILFAKGRFQLEEVSFIVAPVPEERTYRCVAEPCVPLQCCTVDTLSYAF